MHGETVRCLFVSRFTDFKNVQRSLNFQKSVVGSAEANFLKNAVCSRREKERVAEAAMKVGSIGDRGGIWKDQKFQEEE